jgi:hypothetical protein
VDVIFGLAGLALVVWFWVDSLRARERALEHAKNACADAGVQFLDDSLALFRLRSVRRGIGALTLLRVYHFEFSRHGADRHKGTVSVVGLQPVQVSLEEFGARTVLPMQTTRDTNND